MLWSCRAFDRQEDIIPRYTPYLEMKVGKIALVPYAPPGSPELFSAFQESVSKGDAFLLKTTGESWAAPPSWRPSTASRSWRRAPGSPV